MSEKEPDAPKQEGPQTASSGQSTPEQPTTNTAAPRPPESTEHVSENSAAASKTPNASEKKAEASKKAAAKADAPTTEPATDAATTDNTPADTSGNGDTPVTDSSEQQEKKRTPIWLIILVFINLVLIIALAAGYWMDRRDQRADVQATQSGIAVLDDRLGRAEGSINKNRSSGSRNASDTARYSKQVSRLKDQIAHNTDLLAKLPGAERQDWLLAEAEYLMRLANQRLTLEKDWQGAIAMLQAADAVVLETNNPRYDNVRAQLSKETLALRQVPAVDVVGAVNRLQALQDAIEQLDWRPQHSMPSQPLPDLDAPESQAWYQTLWTNVRDLVMRMVVIRFDHTVDIPIGPEHQYQLQYGMHLMLEQAQIAVLRRQQALYDRSLNRVGGWLERNLINDSSSARAVRETLTELKGWNIDPQMPDIKGSLMMLRDVLEKQRRGVFNTPTVPDAKPASKPAPAVKAKPAPAPVTKPAATPTTTIKTTPIKPASTDATVTEHAAESSDAKKPAEGDK